jgi:pimeloyl-ACP methyl ester carboxylesterase
MKLTKIFTPTSPKIEIATIEEALEGKQPLLFIHAVSMGSYEFEQNFLPYFHQKGYDVYAMNWRGHGESEGKGTFKKHTLLDYYKDVENSVEFVTKRTEQEPILIGHSTGGLLTQLYMSKHNVETAVLLGVGDGEKSIQGLVAFLSSAYPELAQQYFASGNSDILMKNKVFQHAIMFNTETQPTYADKIIEKMTTQGASDQLFVDYTTFKTPAPMGNPSVLIITGEKDPIGTIDSVKTLANFYKGEYHVIGKHKHEITMSKGWEEAASEIEKFLSHVTV